MIRAGSIPAPGTEKAADKLFIGLSAAFLFVSVKTYKDDCGQALFLYFSGVVPVWCRKNCTNTDGLEKFSSSEICKIV